MAERACSALSTRRLVGSSTRLLRYGLRVALLVSFISCGAVASRPQHLAPGDHTIRLAHGGRGRAYIVHVPPDTAGPLPLVLSFHGGGGNAEGHKRQVGWDELADEEGFLAVSPYGTGPYGGWRLLTWNAGNCCGYAQKQNVDDVGFVRAIVDDLSRRANVDSGRIFATGLSNGAMMSYRLAAEAPDLIAAFAPVGGVVLVDSIRGRRPIPFMHIHSVDDPRALYDGGLAPPFPLTRERFDHVAVDTVLAQWILHNGCPAEPRIGERRTGAPGSESEGHIATRLVYGPCADDVEIVLWKLQGPGHVWPGSPQRLPERLVGSRTDVIDATREIWVFLREHPSTGSASQ